MHIRKILVSTFIAPDAEQILASAETGCDAFEMHTGPYANAKTPGAVKRRLAELERGKELGLENKLVVHAGHGLTYRNIGPVASISDLCEFNIGHSIVSRAVLVGMEEATAEMISLIEKFSP